MATKNHDRKPARRAAERSVDSTQSRAIAETAGRAIAPPDAVRMSEIDGAYSRLQVAVGALNEYVLDLAERLKPVLRQVPSPSGPKVERAPMQSQIGTKIAQEADGVEAACHGISTLLATLAV